LLGILESCVADGASRGFLPRAVLLGEVFETFSLVALMAGGTAAQGDGFALVLDGLVVIRGLVGGHHGVGAAVAGGAG